MRYRGDVSLLVVAVALAGCPAEVLVAPEGGGDASGGAPSEPSNGGNGASGQAPAGMPGCAAFVQVGEPVAFAIGNTPELATIDASFVGLYHSMPVGEETTLVLEHPFETWPPTTTSYIPRLYGPDPNGLFHARPDGVFVSNGQVLSFWEDAELAEPPSSDGSWDPRLEPDGEGIFWSSNELTMYFPSLSPSAPTTTIDGAWRFASLDAAGRAVFRATNDDGLSLVRLDDGQLLPMLVTTPAPSAADAGEIALLPWERGLWAISTTTEPDHIALGIEGLAEAGPPKPIRVLELPPSQALGVDRFLAFRGGALGVYVQDQGGDDNIIVAVTDGEHLTLAQEPIGQACTNRPGVAMSPDGATVLVATGTCDEVGGFVIRRFDCVE